MRPNPGLHYVAPDVPVVPGDSGWVSPSANTSVVDGGSSSWSNAGNTYASDNSRASVSGFSTSHWMVLRGFGLSIPENATIVGIEIRVEARDVPDL